MTVKDLKKGEFFTLKPVPYPTEKQVYIRDDFDRSEKKYLVIRFDDCSSSRLLKRDTPVYTDFIF